ncbi:MAG TPA: Fic family protein [Acidobacteriaceae bacterium]|nr:Fic family protein [Acidobacteriaceae bacterium]
MPGTFCPLNRYGIRDYTLLQQVEASAVHRRQVQIEDLGITGRFDTAHLRGIHHHLFQDVFPWAGELRLVGLSKPGSAPFAAPQYITSALDDLFRKLPSENHLRNLTPEAFAGRAAFYLGEINAVHPFREGNGRTQREFIRQLAAQAGHTISWAGFTQEGMTVASILSHTRGDNTQLASIMEAAILPAEPTLEPQ